VGLGDFFRCRRERERAIPPSAQAEQPSEALGSFATPEEQPVVGEQVGGGLGSVELGERAEWTASRRSHSSAR
jgi:hypothetical protein